MKCKKIFLLIVIFNFILVLNLKAEDRSTIKFGNQTLIFKENFRVQKVFISQICYCDRSLGQPRFYKYSIIPSYSQPVLLKWNKYYSIDYWKINQEDKTFNLIGNRCYAHNNVTWETKYQYSYDGVNWDYFDSTAYENGGSTNYQDLDGPNITLNGRSEIEISKGETYVEFGASANDYVEGDKNVAISGEVDETKPGIYQISYYAVDSKGNSSTVMRTVTVPDEEPPNIVFSDLVIEVGTSSVYWYKDVIITDNFSLSENIFKQILGEIDLNKLGEYQIIYRATDEAGNSVEEIRTVLVVDTVKPVIVGAVNFEVEVNGSLTDYLNSVTASDNVDGDLTDLMEIDYSAVIMNVPGLYPLVYSVKDNSGNEKIIPVTVLVVDNQGPEILGITIFYLPFKTVKPDWLVGVYATDNVDQTVEVTPDDSQVNLNAVGDYQLLYLAEDHAGNVTIETTRVIVEDKVAPIISGIKLWTVGVNQPNINWLTGVTAVDDVDGTVDVKVEDNQVNLRVLGRYQLLYRAVDNAGNVTTKTTTVVVKDKVAPIISGIKLWTVGVNSQNINWLVGVTAVDDVDGTVVVTFDDTEVSLNAVGRYQLFYRAEDNAGNVTIKTTTVVVEDKVAPIISGVKLWNVGVNQSNINWLAGVTAIDNLDGTVVVTFVLTEVNLSAVGRYQLLYRAVDNAGNVTTKTTTVVVKDKVAPIISGIKLWTVAVNEPDINWLAGVTAVDNLDGTVGVTFDDTEVSLSAVGSYQLIYQATDHAGNVTIKTTSVLVEDRVAPIITGVKLWTVGVNEPDINWLAGVTAVDDLDGTVVVTFDDTEISLSVVGSYQLIYQATDNAGNISTTETTVTVIDNQPPVILSQSAKLNFEVGTVVVEEMDFNQYIEASDGQSLNLTIENDAKTAVDFNKIGNYEINYSVSDQAGNYVYTTIPVVVEDLTPPLIETTEIIFEAGEIYDGWLNNITVIDNYDESSEIEISYQLPENLNYRKVGNQQKITFTAVDKSNNQSVIDLAINIVDTTAPIILNAKQIYLKIGATSNIFLTDLQAEDNSSDELEITFDDSSIDYLKSGSYLLKYQVQDTSGNIYETEVIVVVYDIASQLLGESELIIEYGNEYIEAGIVVTSGLNSEFSEKILSKGEVNVNLLGEYRIDYYVELLNQEIYLESRVIKIVDTRAPDIYADVEHFNIKVNDKFSKSDILMRLSASDNYDGDLTNKLNFSEEINIKKPGTTDYFVSVVDTSGNMTQKIITVTVDSSNVLIKIALTVGVSGIVLVKLLLFMRKKF